MLFAKAVMNVGAAFDTNEGDAFVTVEKAADADDVDASVAIEENVGESAKDI